MLQELAVGDVADELAVLLEARHADDALAQLGVAHADAQALGFGHDRLLEDHLLDDALADPELLEHVLVDVAAERLAVLEQLLRVQACGRCRR